MLCREIQTIHRGGKSPPVVSTVRRLPVRREGHDDDAGARLEVISVPIGFLKPNPWNPNVQDSFIFEKEKESIRRFGFVVPITVREMGDSWEIIDGEHRWKAAKELGYLSIPVIVIDVTEEEAKQLTIVLNETRGEANPEKLKALLADLTGSVPMAELMTVLPFSPEKMDSILGNFDWDGAEAPNKPTGAEKTVWTLRSYRMPPDAAAVLDEAISRLQREDKVPDWRALELIAAEYLGGE
jgi:hypothetical protein